MTQNVQELIMTCPRCDGANPRPLPYSLVKPDKCDHCPHYFRTKMSVALMDYRLWRRQSKLASAIETVVNIGTGLVIAFFAQLYICWLFNIPLSASDNAIIVWCMTIISVIRSYVVRRIWNNEPWKGKRRG